MPALLWHWLIGLLSQKTKNKKSLPMLVRFSATDMYSMCFPLEIQLIFCTSEPFLLEIGDIGVRFEYSNDDVDIILVALIAGASI